MYINLLWCHNDINQNYSLRVKRVTVMGIVSTGIRYDIEHMSGKVTAFDLSGNVQDGMRFGDLSLFQIEICETPLTHVISFEKFLDMVKPRDVANPIYGRESYEHV